MNNIGSEWLHSIGLQNADPSTKICALTALEISLGGLDAFEHIWLGNLFSEENALRAVRRTMVRYGSPRALMASINKPYALLEEFLKGVGVVG